MKPTTEECLDAIVARISAMQAVQAVGISGGKSPLPEKGEGDIDVFIYCDELPSLADRQAVLLAPEGHAENAKVRVFEGGRWGSGDFMLINGVETWLMYFTLRETREDVDAILAGKWPDKLDNAYYPIGRLGMLSRITVLFDRSGFLQTLKNRLAVYPPELGKTLADHHLRMLGDTEDLNRAVTRRDALFYHFALDLALDHFLQALFAMNRCYFPSRKRTLQYIGGFQVKPENCEARLLQTLRLGGSGETVPQSYAVWESLTAELAGLYAAAGGGTQQAKEKSNE